MFSLIVFSSKQPHAVKFHRLTAAVLFDFFSCVCYNYMKNVDTEKEKTEQERHQKMNEERSSPTWAVSPIQYANLS